MTVEKILSSSKGQILIFIALAFVVLGLLVGLAVDAGRGYLLQARLSRLADAVAMAGARALPGASSFTDAVDKAIAAACDLAGVYGINSAECGDGPRVFVTVGDVTDPDGKSLTGVTVRAVDTLTTSFMQLGKFVGCGSLCNEFNVSATGAAAPDTLIDVVLVVDTTKSMDFGCNLGEENCPIKQLQKGAKALIDCLLGTDCGVTSSGARIGLVPFRACYNSEGSGDCVDDSGDNNKIVNLTDSISTLTKGIDDLTAKGFTNVCTGIDKGKTVLLSGARAIARKVMIVLTDGSNHFGGDDPGGTCSLPSGSDDNVNKLDDAMNDMATDLKQNSNVEIYVLRYAACDLPPWQSDCGDALDPNVCTPGDVGNGGSNRNDRDNDPRDRNLSRCIASNKPNGDPFSTDSNDPHYSYAANPQGIKSGFGEIAEELLKRLRLVN